MIGRSDPPSNWLLEEVARRLQTWFGLRPEAVDRSALARALRSRAKGGPESADEECIRRLEENPDERDALRQELLVGETHFLRHRRALNLLVEDVLKPTFVRRGAPVRVWCAACSSGEEAYSVAFLLREAGVPARVLGTDVCERFLERARRGIYGPWSFRGLSPEEYRLWFEPHPQGARVRDRFREGVAFARHDLLADPPPDGGPFDAVLCRNVLIYFDEASVRSAVERVRASLRPEGVLVVGPAETGHPAVAWMPGLPGSGGMVRRIVARASKPTDRGGPSEAPPCSRSAARPRPRPRPAPPVPSDPPSEPALPSSDESTIRALCAKGRSGEALRLVEEGLRRRPDDPDLHAAAAFLHIERGDALAAVRSGKRALFLDPGRADARALLALAALRLGRRSLAEREARRALEGLAAPDAPDRCGEWSREELLVLVRRAAGRGDREERT